MLRLCLRPKLRDLKKVPKDLNYVYDHGSQGKIEYYPPVRSRTITEKEMSFKNNSITVEKNIDQNIFIFVIKYAINQKSLESVLTLRYVGRILQNIYKRRTLQLDKLCAASFRPTTSLFPFTDIIYGINVLTSINNKHDISFIKRFYMT